MAFYLEPLEHRKCQKCGKPATQELKTSGTVSYGYFCAGCGRREVVARNKRMEEFRKHS